MPRDRREHSLGSGVIISPVGYVPTNNHVVDGASEIKVTLADKREYAARVVGRDPGTDIALKGVSVDELTPEVVRQLRCCLKLSLSLRLHWTCGYEQ